jgi:hypothetical protein
MADENERQRRNAERLPLATENAAMPQSETISEFGETAAKEREIAIERAEDPESGGVAEQRTYLRREAEIDAEERDQRADRADIHNAPHVQAEE